MGKIATIKEICDATKYSVYIPDISRDDYDIICPAKQLIMNYFSERIVEGSLNSYGSTQLVQLEDIDPIIPTYRVLLNITCNGYREVLTAEKTSGSNIGYKLYIQCNGGTISDYELFSGSDIYQMVSTWKLTVSSGWSVSPTSLPIMISGFFHNVYRSSITIS